MGRCVQCRDHHNQNAVAVNTVANIDVAGICRKDVPEGFGKGCERFRELTGEISMLFTGLLSPG